jgi:hypothetical protein
VPTGLSVINFKDLYSGDWALDWNNATASFWKIALYGAKTIDFSAALAYGTTPFNTGEQAGSGYTAGGMNVPGRTVAETGAGTGIIAFTATFMEWNPITTTTLRTALIYQATGSKALGAWDLGTPADVAAGVIRITYASDRVVTHKVIP